MCGLTGFPIIVTRQSQNGGWTLPRKWIHQTSEVLTCLCWSLHSHPHLVRVSTAASCISNSQYVASRSCQVACCTLLNSSWRFWACCLTSALKLLNCLSSVCNFIFKFCLARPDGNYVISQFFLAGTYLCYNALHSILDGIYVIC
jgi:hypothetical protein